MEAPKLLPCPFCGGPAEMWHASGNRPAWIACMGRCAVLVTKENETDEAAVATWNTRTDAILSDPRVKALAEALRWAVGREEFEADMEGRSENIWVRDASAALAAIKEAPHD